MTDLFAALPVEPIDQAQRDLALDISRSIIVQAPAGSGKTDLLTRRFLKLLAAVDEPEEILAITFTRAATAEMRARILSDLEAAAGRRSHLPEEYERIELARAALRQSERRNWQLLDQPQRLIIETIDSLCLRIAHDQPLLARLGGRLQPTEHVAQLYALAARRTLSHLGGRNTSLSVSIAHLLRLRDNNLPDCEGLIANMLARRDQWAHAFPLIEDIDWDTVRSQLEKPFRQEVTRVLTQAHSFFHDEPLIASELIELANYACCNANSIDIALLASLQSIPGPNPGLLEHWKCLANFLLTKDGEWRRRFAKYEGFPGGKAGSREKDQIGRIERVRDYLRSIPGLLDILYAVRKLPPARYDKDQWQTLRHLFTTLRHAVAELRVLFAEQDKVDFIEIAIAALDVLKHTNPDRMLALSGNLRHLLIDEFQDTSRRQHELIQLLLTAWEPSDGRTCFLVGDPMQSIYMFRQAEVELFAQVRDHGIVTSEGTIECDPVQLSTNFRSHAGLTDKLNTILSRVFAGETAPGAAAVAFTESFASAEALPGQAIYIHPQIIGTTDNKPTDEEKQAAKQTEAEEILSILRQHLPAIEQARASNTEYRVAVLVRARQHLAQIVPLLREAGIPFRAVEIEHLSDRQEFLDLLSLAHALLHPMDRVAWLSVLRAPWCGLTLPDLHTLTGSDDPLHKNTPILELIERHLSLLSAEAQQRVTRTISILKQALTIRYQQSQTPSFASWIERTWRTLGGPQCLDAAAHENTQVFFSMLDAVTPDGIALLTEDFDAQFHQLFAPPDPSVSERCGIQLMTIHKAKGLGFEVVLVPGLERKPAHDRPSLIVSLERTTPYNSSEGEFLVAPIGLKGGSSHPLYKWVQRQRSIRFDEERKRLLYVACTRARNTLHLFGTATVTSSGLKPGDPKSLLACAWPALQPYFVKAQPKQTAPATNLLLFPIDQPVNLDIAATVEDHPARTLRRLPFDAMQPVSLPNLPVTSTSPSQQTFTRPEGSRQARILGRVTHVLLDRLSTQIAGGYIDEQQARRHASALLRAAALSGSALEEAAQSIIKTLIACATDPIAQWILNAHPEAQSEASWTGWFEGQLRTFRADRIFRAGAEPQTSGTDCFWIIDYKTSPAHIEDHESFLKTQRAIYASQLETYGRALRAIHGANTPLRLGLYYPQLTRLDWWEED